MIGRACYRLPRKPISQVTEIVSNTASATKMAPGVCLSPHPARAIERALTKAGYQVISVGDGQEGLLRAQDLHPELILLDMMLPTLEGTSVFGS
jgi:PleD family two-component response regulator